MELVVAVVKKPRKTRRTKKPLNALINAVPVVKKPRKTCPDACKAPAVVNGLSENGGVNLVEGICKKWASKRYGWYQKRYCGDGNNATNSKSAYYTADGGINCAPLCAASKRTKKPLNALINAVAVAKKPKPRKTCPDACKAPAVVNGLSENGGVNLVEGICKKWASKRYGWYQKRYCGDGNNATNSKSAYYTADGGINCAPLCAARTKKPLNALIRSATSFLSTTSEVEITEAGQVRRDSNSSSRRIVDRKHGKPTAKTQNHGGFTASHRYMLLLRRFPKASAAADQWRAGDKLYRLPSPSFNCSNVVYTKQRALRGQYFHLPGRKKFKFVFGVAPRAGKIVYTIQKRQGRIIFKGRLILEEVSRKKSSASSSSRLLVARRFPQSLSAPGQFRPGDRFHRGRRPEINVVRVVHANNHVGDLPGCQRRRGSVIVGGCVCCGFLPGARGGVVVYHCFFSSATALVLCIIAWQSLDIPICPYCL